MVSPCKKKKLDKKGRETTGENSTKHSERRHSKSVKPFANKRFYFDIRNQSSLKKVEEKVISLGGKVELFLVKEVDYVVTDKEDREVQQGAASSSLQSPSPGPSPSPSPSPALAFSPALSSVSPATVSSPTNDGIAAKRTRCRAEAMLDRVKQQPIRHCNQPNNILEKASAWKIPIYSLAKFLGFVEKCAKKVQSATQQGNVRLLRGSFLKLETSARPEFKVFSSWPRLDSDCGSWSTLERQPASPHNASAQRMTRKVKGGAGGVRDVSSGVPGYCEVCRVHFGVLDQHLVSPGHLKAVQDPAQYSQLESYIANNSLGVRKSLRIAKSPTHEPMGAKQSADTSASPGASGALPVLSTPNGLGSRRDRERRDSGSKVSPPSPSDSTPQFPLCNGISSPSASRRTRGTKPSQETPEKEVESPVVEKRRLSMSPPSAPVSKESFSNSPAPHALRSSGRLQPPCSPPPRSKVARKRPSADEKLIEDNRAYYKVEVLNSKLRSTGLLQKQARCGPGINGDVEESCVKTEDEKEPVVVRFKKVRRSQLSVLSDEAENFMFREPVCRSKGDSSPPTNGPRSSSDTEVKEKRKRRSFSEEKVEPSKAGMVTPEACPRRTTEEEHRLESPEEAARVAQALGQVGYSFSRNPELLAREPWFPVSQGQTTYFQRYYSYPVVTLPYQVPEYERLKALCVRRPGRRPRGLGPARLAKLLDDRPRKSPRCHASTLAIMSSLMRRRGRSSALSPLAEEPTDEETRSSMPDTLDSNSNSMGSDVRSLGGDDMITVAARLEAFITATMLENEDDIIVRAVKDYVAGLDITAISQGDQDFPPFKVPEVDGPCMQVDPDILLDPDMPVFNSPATSSGPVIPFAEIIETLPSCTALDKALQEQLAMPRPSHLSFNLDSCNSSECSDLVGMSEDGRLFRKVRKKRKRNLTGWPSGGRPRKRGKLFGKTEGGEDDLFEEGCEVVPPPTGRKRGRPRKILRSSSSIPSTPSLPSIPPTPATPATPILANLLHPSPASPTTPRSPSPVPSPPPPTPKPRRLFSPRRPRTT